MLYKLIALQSTEKEIKNTRDSILKLLRGPGIDSKESTPGLLKSLQIRSLYCDGRGSKMTHGDTEQCRIC
jgi:hypothetical protein